MSVSVLPFFSETKFPLFFKVESLWKHCVGVALGCYVISDFLELEINDKAYACGLIHGVGQSCQNPLRCHEFQQRTLVREKEKK